MNTEKQLQNINKPFLQISSWEYKIALYLGIITSVGSIAAVTYYIGYADALREGGKFGINDFHIFMVAAHIWICLGLIIYALGFFLEMRLCQMLWKQF